MLIKGKSTGVCMEKGVGRRAGEQGRLLSKSKEGKGREGRLEECKHAVEKQSRSREWAVAGGCPIIYPIGIYLPFQLPFSSLSLFQPYSEYSNVPGVLTFLTVLHTTYLLMLPGTCHYLPGYSNV